MKQEIGNKYRENCARCGWHQFAKSCHGTDLRQKRMCYDCEVQPFFHVANRTCVACKWGVWFPVRICYWELCKTMKSQDVEHSVERALGAAGLMPGQRPSLLSDNGACYVASEPKRYLKEKGIVQLHGKIGHPKTQGKFERYHRRRCKK